jgi:DNA-binding NtrC family response regulator
MNVPTILLFDEEQLMREATAMLLANRGGKVTKAATLEEAIAHLGKRTYDVAVIDLSDGAPRCVEILKKMREQDCLPRRVIVCTSSPVGRGEADEFTDVLLKPYPFDRLLDAVFGKPQAQRRPSRPGLFPLARRIKTLRRSASPVRRSRV